MKNYLSKGLMLLASCLLLITVAHASGDTKAPDRKTGKGPYKRLILRGGIVIRRRLGHLSNI